MVGYVTGFPNALCPRRLDMKIVMKVKKGGEPAAQFAYELEKGEKPVRGAARALMRLCKENPNISLFDSDIEVKFEKVE
jgi:hypothetical protein